MWNNNDIVCLYQCNMVIHHKNGKKYTFDSSDQNLNIDFTNNFIVVSKMTNIEMKKYFPFSSIDYFETIEHESVHHE